MEWTRLSRWFRGPLVNRRWTLMHADVMRISQRDHGPFFQNGGRSGVYYWEADSGEHRLHRRSMEGTERKGFRFRISDCGLGDNTDYTEGAQRAEKGRGDFRFEISGCRLRREGEAPSEPKNQPPRPPRGTKDARGRASVLTSRVSLVAPAACRHRHFQQGSTLLRPQRRTTAGGQDKQDSPGRKPGLRLPDLPYTIRLLWPNTTGGNAGERHCR